MRLLPLILGAFLFGAQAPVDMPFYAVAYVEVMPASRAAAFTAFKQYRDASRKEEGFVRFELFEQVGRPGHLAVIEAWANSKAFDAHAADGHAKEWRSRIDAMRLSDYDQRPYKPLSIGPPLSSAADRTTYVISHVDIGGQGTNAADILKRLAEASRREDGNRRFDVLQHTIRANHFTVVEAWQDQKALDAHAAAAHTRQYRDSLAPITGSPLDERIFNIVE
jgi:quinol monooxygenase YgiN